MACLNSWGKSFTACTVTAIYRIHCSESLHHVPVGLHGYFSNGTVKKLLVGFLRNSWAVMPADDVVLQWRDAKI